MSPCRWSSPTIGSVVDALESLAAGRDLSADDARSLLEQLIAGQVPDPQAGALLALLRAKGASAGELVAFVALLREHMAPLNHGYSNLIDTCGTGGGPATFNISTAAALVVAAAGGRVAKHGNRAVTSLCGSADVLEALGVRLSSEPEHLLHLLETVRIAFLFAPSHHPALKAVGPVRKALGIRTVFNQLGPMLNPAGASIQLIGVYDYALAEPMADALRTLGSKRAAVGCGHDGLDEMSPFGPSTFVILDQGEIRTQEFHPTMFGVDPVAQKDVLPGDSPASNGPILRTALASPKSPYARAVVPSAGMALWLGGLCPDLESAGQLALEVIASGKALTTLETLITESNQ